MASEDLIQDVAGCSLDQIRFCVTGDFNPDDDGTNWTIGTPTDVLLTLASLASGSARQSDKVDLGATRAPEYEVLGCVDFTGEVPVAGQTIEYWWAPSTHGTQANGNMAGNSGADAACPGGAVGEVTLEEFLKMGCDFIGVLNIHDGAAVQNGKVGVLRPTSRYGQLIVINYGCDVFEEDNVEHHQVFNPIVHEGQ